MKGIRLSDLAAGKCRTEARFGEDVVTLAYRPYLDTEIEAAAEPDGGRLTNDTVRRFLSAVLLEWDLLGDDGQPLPIDVETLRGVPIDILAPIFDAIRFSTNPPTRAATPSSATSDAGSLAAAK